jgi:hypothetical protein
MGVMKSFNLLFQRIRELRVKENRRAGEEESAKEELRLANAYRDVEFDL